MRVVASSLHITVTLFAPAAQACFAARRTRGAASKSASISTSCPCCTFSPARTTSSAYLSSCASKFILILLPAARHRPKRPAARRPFCLWHNYNTTAIVMPRGVFSFAVSRRFFPPSARAARLCFRVRHSARLPYYIYNGRHSARKKAVFALFRGKAAKSAPFSLDTPPGGA